MTVSPLVAVVVTDTSMLNWALAQVPMPDPIRTVVRVLMTVITVIVCLYLLIGILPPPRPLLR